MNKERLLKYMQIAYANVEQAAAGLSSSQISEVGAEGEWSAKDMIAHIGYWMQREADNLKTARGQTVENFYDSRMSVDAANKLVYNQNRDREITEIMQNLRRAYRDLVEEVEQLSDADLTETTRYAWTDGGTLASSIASESFEHINEHLVTLRNYMKSVKGQAWPRA